LADIDFSGKVVVVTGVGRTGQIGHAVATRFGRAGARLVLADVNAVAVATRAREFERQGMQVCPAAGDLTQPDVASWLIEQATDTFGRVDVLVNVAGGLSGTAPLVDAGPEVLEKELAMNTRTMYVVSRAAATAMMAQRSGAIVSFASMAALHARPEMAAYSASKAAVAAITRSLALELRPYGVRVNAVAPGTVRTGDNRASMAGAENVTWVETADVVDAVYFLASDLARGITGHVLPVSLGEL
jgi:NAD(P)-dependent dehydrogenase (short-subunit alcohol dehydrogenase family)